MALSYATLDTVTREVWRKKIADNIYNGNAIFRIMYEDGRVSVREGGGSKIFEPIKYAKSTSVGSYTRGGTFDISFQDNLTKAEFDWAYYYGNATLFGQDLAENAGPNQIIDLMAETMDEADMALRDKIGDDLYAGTAAPNIIGLASAVDATTTYGGIAVADFSGWASGESATAHTAAQLKDSSDSTHYIKDLLAAGVRSATHLGQKPNLIVLPLLIWDIYESVLETQARYVKNARQEMIASAGYSVLNFRDIPVVADEKATAGTVWFLNTNFMKFNILSTKNFEWSGWKKPTNQDSMVGQFTLGCQLSINNRRMFYKYTGFPTS